ncbi:MAG: aldo/keto reductase [Bryobacteraceae bacterium]|nr:aldo/keto reductase [Bryobacteraceae bacterium]
MNRDEKVSATRRSFLAAGMALPAAGLASVRAPGAAFYQAPAALPVRTLGKTGMKVTRLGFGCMITSDPSVISRAVDAGITYFDTARRYQQGNNERMVGAALKGARSRITLSSKSGGKTKTEAMQDLETSLKELGTDHLDIWYMHARDEAAAIPDECLEAWTAAKKEGKIRAIGVSTHNPNNIADRVMQAGIFDVVLVQYNFASGNTIDATLKRFFEAGIGLVGMKVVAPAAGRGRGGAAATPPVPGKPVAALKWVLRNPLIDTIIPSMTDMDQLEANLRAVNEKFGPEDEKLLAALNEEIRPYYCRACHQCDGQCPQGLPVADVIRFASYTDFYGQYSVGRERFLELPERLQKVRCEDCGACAIRCPNGVRVQERLIRAQQLYA